MCIGEFSERLRWGPRADQEKIMTDELRWDFATSVEEVMTHLHAFVMARQVLYLGVSDTPAWVVVKANECKPSTEPPPHRAMWQVLISRYSCPQERADAILHVPGSVERCVQGHGSRDYPYVRGPRHGNYTLGGPRGWSVALDRAEEAERARPRSSEHPLQPK